jgi:arylsulfatase A-like enzyme
MERGIRDRTRYPKANANTQYPAEDHLRVRQNYSAMVENLDRWTGRYIDELRKRGELDNTIVLYGSDHGEMLGDHNRWGKTVPYQASEGVPLVAAGPGIEKGKTSSTLVTLVDLAATFLDYAGVAKPKEMDSVSLRPVLEGRRNQHRPHVASALGKWRSISDGNYKLVTGFEDKGPALFDVKDDPLENTNLAAKKPAETERLSRLMAT